MRENPIGFRYFGMIDLNFILSGDALTPRSSHRDRRAAGARIDEIFGVSGCG
jgi:hypothetical protein